MTTWPRSCEPGPTAWRRHEDALAERVTTLHGAASHALGGERNAGVLSCAAVGDLNGAVAALTAWCVDYLTTFVTNGEDAAQELRATLRERRTVADGAEERSCRICCGGGRVGAPPDGATPSVMVAPCLCAGTPELRLTAAAPGVPVLVSPPALAKRSGKGSKAKENAVAPSSYTHLTSPTIYSV